jgi:hypothetical protein
MKKMFLSIVMGIAINTTIQAQSVDSVSLKGLILTLHCHKIMTLICREQNMRFIDSNQVKAKHNYKYTSHTEFHAKSAFDKYVGILKEIYVKIDDQILISIEHSTVPANAISGLEADYFNKLMFIIKNKGENAQDKIDENAAYYQVEDQPHKALHLYECVLSVPGEYEIVYASPKVASQTFNIPYDIVIDYSNAARTLYQIIKECHVGEDNGEWSTFNNIANSAYTTYNSDHALIWRNFLSALSTKLPVDGTDQGSWRIVKDAAAGALMKAQPVDQFGFFCSRVRYIVHPSHNFWAWARITDFANKYAK